MYACVGAELQHFRKFFFLGGQKKTNLGIIGFFRKFFFRNNIFKLAFRSVCIMPIDAENDGTINIPIVEYNFDFVLI